MEKVFVLLALISLTRNVYCSPEKAGQCLIDLKDNITASSLKEDWEDSRADFFSALNKVTDTSRTKILFRQLRILESFLKYEGQTNSWKHWKRNYWSVMTNTDLDVSESVTRFIITVKFMEDNLLSSAFKEVWMNSKRDEWIKECCALVDPLLRLAFYDEMFQNVDALLQQFNFSSLDDYNMKATKVISDIKSATQNLEEGVISIDRQEVEEVKARTEDTAAVTMALIELLASYASSASDLKAMLYSLGNVKATEYLHKAGIAPVTARTNHGTLDVARMTKIVRVLVPDLLLGFGIDEATHSAITTDGVPKLINAEGESLASIVAKLNSFLPVVSPCFGFWDFIREAYKHKGGIIIPKEFRNMTEELSFAKNYILSYFGFEEKTSFVEYFVGNRTDSQNRPEVWRRACLPEIICVDLALLSYEVTAEESDNVCRSIGEHLLSVQSQEISDAVRQFVKIYGTSAWISTHSSYVAWEPNSPRDGGCIYFSASDSFFVKETSCNSAKKSAILCS